VLENRPLWERPKVPSSLRKAVLAGGAGVSAPRRQDGRLIEEGGPERRSGAFVGGSPVPVRRAPFAPSSKTASRSPWPTVANLNPVRRYC